MTQPPSPMRRSPAPGVVLRERTVVIGLGLVLAAALYVYFKAEEKRAGPKLPPPTPAIKVDTTPYRPDPAILAKVKDGTRLERVSLESGAWENLLRRSYNITPIVAEALGLSESPPDIAAIRKNPAVHRGSYMWFRGRLEEFSARRVHPLPRATSYFGRLRTSDGEPVMFWVSQPLPQGVEIGNPKQDWVRVEGFFMKIQDDMRVEGPDFIGVPLLVGPELLADYPDWNPVQSLDPRILDSVQNAWRDKDKVWHDTRDFETMLLDSESLPLWHMASFARNRLQEQLTHKEFFEQREQYNSFRDGEYKPGHPIAIRGQIRDSRWWKAQPNPAGIEHWSEVWVQIPRLGAKVVPLWIPRRIDLPEYLDVECDAFFFKNYSYEMLDRSRRDAPPGSRMHTPLFVAADLRKFELKIDLLASRLAWSMAGLGLLVIILFAFFARRSRRESEESKLRLVERQRHRRNRPATSG